MNFRTLGDVTRQLKNQLVGANQAQEPLAVKTPVAPPVPVKTTRPRKTK